MYLVISCSLNSFSRSRTLARAAHQALVDAGEEADFVDLRDLSLPLCDGDACFRDPNGQRLAETIHAAAGVLVASPIYNYDVSASARNLVELTGDAWEDQVVGFLCAAGGRASYMAVMGLANSLMLDFRSFILPRFVYASKRSFQGEELDDPKVDDRLRELMRELVRVSTALKR